MRLKHKCEKCKRDMTIDLELLPKELRVPFIYAVWKGNGQWCINCRKGR